MPKQDRGLAKADAAVCAASVVFAREGYRRTTVNAVLEEGGLSQGSVYAHFRSKDELARGVVERQDQILQGLLDTASRETAPAPQRLDNLLASLASIITSHPEVRAGLRLRAEAPELFPRAVSVSLDTWRLAVEDLLREGIAAGSIRADIDSRSVAKVVVQSIVGMISTSIATTDGEDLIEVTGGYLALAIASLTT